MGNFIEHFGGLLFFFLGLWLLIGSPIMLSRGGTLYLILGFFPVGIVLLWMISAVITSILDDLKEKPQNGKFWPQ